jgi:hypothetical protein
VIGQGTDGNDDESAGTSQITNIGTSTYSRLMAPHSEFLDNISVFFVVSLSIHL